MPEKRKVILFQGDSITDGNRGRDEDPNHIIGHSYAFIITGKLGLELAEQKPLFINRGISGNRVSDLYARWNEDAISLQPDVISILAGVNDAWGIFFNDPRGASDRFERAYRHLLAETKEVLPQTKLILCEPFTLKVGAPAENWNTWKELITNYQRIVRELAEQFNTLFVPLQEVFDQAAEIAEPSYWIWDGVHPTTAGHELIAREWLKVAEGLF